MSLHEVFNKLKGGSGSGNFGHGGRPGKRGGSTPKGSGLSGPVVASVSVSAISSAVKRNIKGTKNSGSRSEPVYQIPLSNRNNVETMLLNMGMSAINKNTFASKNSGAKISESNNSNTFNLELYKID